MSVGQGPDSQSRYPQCVGEVTLRAWGFLSGLLLTHYTLKVLRCHRKEATQLFNALIRDVTGRVGCDGLIQKFLGLFVVGLRYVQGVLQRGLMFQR